MKVDDPSGWISMTATRKLRLTVQPEKDFGTAHSSLNLKRNLGVFY